MSDRMKIGVGDVEYSELSKSIKFTIVLNDKAIEYINETLLMNDSPSTEDTVAAARSILHRGILTDLTRGGMRIYRGGDQ